MGSNGSNLIGTAEAAELLNCHPRTVKRWAQNGKLRHAVKMPGDTGAYLFRANDVERLAKELEGAAT